MIDQYSWITVYPEIVLLTLACVIAMVDLFVKSPQRTATYVLTLITLGVVAVMQAENPDLDWVLPDQGGILWSQSLAVFEDSKNKDLALKFVQYIMSPKGQALLATSSCFWGMPANKKAGDELTAEQKAALRWDEQEGFLAKSHRYFIPDAELDAEMLDVWTEFLQH